MESNKFAGFIDWLKDDAVDWGDPDSEEYEYPLRPDAPQSAVDAYESFLKEKEEARKQGLILD